MRFNHKVKGNNTFSSHLEYVIVNWIVYFCHNFIAWEEVPLHTPKYTQDNSFSNINSLNTEATWLLC